MKKGNSIKFSYSDEQELQRVLEKLGDLVLKVKRPDKQAGQYKTAYIILKTI